MFYRLLKSLSWVGFFLHIQWDGIKFYFFLFFLYPHNDLQNITQIVNGVKHKENLYTNWIEKEKNKLCSSALYSRIYLYSYVRVTVRLSLFIVVWKKFIYSIIIVGPTTRRVSVSVKLPLKRKSLFVYWLDCYIWAG